MTSNPFRDCLNREIKIGDVIASGHRDGNSGSLSIGVVTGFDANHAILVTKLQRGKWCEYRDGSGKWWMSSDTGDAWKTIKGRCTYGERCFITGLTEDELQKLLPVSAGQEPQG